jgi:hypothetical protein
MLGTLYLADDREMRVNTVHHDGLVEKPLSVRARRFMYILQTAMRSHIDRMAVYQSKVTARNRQCGRHPYLAKVKADPTPSKAQCLTSERYRELPARDLSFPVSVCPAVPSEHLNMMLLSSFATTASSRSLQHLLPQKETAHFDTSGTLTPRASINISNRYRATSPATLHLSSRLR